MKKTLIALSILISASSIAAPMDHTKPGVGEKDGASVGITWKADLPTVLPGKWVTFTGAAGGPITAGAFTIQPDGSFATDEPVVIELHYWNSGNTSEGIKDEVGDIVATGDEYASTPATALGDVQYSVGDVTFASELGADVSGLKAEVTANGTALAPRELSDLGIAGEHVTNWSIANAPGSAFTNKLPGDKITAAAMVSVDIEFVAK